MGLKVWGARSYRGVSRGLGFRVYRAIGRKVCKDVIKVIDSPTPTFSSSRS